MAVLSVSEAVFACHSAACAPPSAGGTGGSNPGRGRGKTPRPSGSGGSGVIRDAHGFPFRDQAAAAKAGLKPKTYAPHPNDRASIDAARKANATQRPSPMPQLTGKVDSKMPQLKSDKNVDPKMAQGPDSYKVRGKKVYDAAGKHVGTLDKYGAIGIKAGGMSTPLHGGTRFYNEMASGRTRKEALANLHKRLEDHAANARARKAGEIPMTFTKTGRATGTHRETVRALGTVKVSDVKVSRDGSISVGGKPTEYRIEKGTDSVSHRSGYIVPGIYSGSQKLRTFKTQALAKAAIVRNIKEIQADS